MDAVFTRLNATHAGILTPARSKRAHAAPFSAGRDAPLPLDEAYAHRSHGFGGELEPRYIFGAQLLDR